MSNQDKVWTVSQVLLFSTQWLENKGIVSSPRLDCELLLSSVIGLSRTSLYMNFDRPLSIQERDQFKLLLRRRSQGEPVAYILGKKEFFTSTFKVNSSTLIPRSDSESLVELALSKAFCCLNQSSFSCLDLGTGSGCLLISIAKALDEKVSLYKNKLKKGTEKKQRIKELSEKLESDSNIDSGIKDLDLSLVSDLKSWLELDSEPKTFNGTSDINPDIKFYFLGLDISCKALEVASENASSIVSSLEVEFKCQDMMQDFKTNTLFDMLISNPPYIEPDDPNLDSSTKFEPQIALCAKDFCFYKRIASLASSLVKHHGYVVVEVGKDQDKTVTQIFKDHGLSLVESQKDLSGIVRAICFRVD